MPPLPRVPRIPLPQPGAVALLLLALVLAWPVLVLLASWWPAADSAGQAQQILAEMARTVLPAYAATSLALCIGVALGVTAVGLCSAVLVTVFDFPLRRTLQWALLLPLAMPAYVVAYAYTDFLQYSGPLQTSLRNLLSLHGRVLPEVRSLGGAVWVFTFTLYPYVYLLARTALSERAPQLLEAARLLGAPLSARLRRVALPLARPAVVAGVALALMETLADYGVVSYFGIQTFTAGIYKAWLAMDNRIAAAQLATLLLAWVVLLMSLQAHAQRRLRFTNSKGTSGRGTEAQPVRLVGVKAALAIALCAIPVFVGFVLPVVFMLGPLVQQELVLPWQAFTAWALNSLRLATITAALAVVLAWLLASSLRQRPGLVTRLAVQTAGLGYAVPGAVIVVGLLLPLGWLQQVLPHWGIAAWMTTTVLGLLWAYQVRFCAVALQTLQSGYARIPASVDDSARMLGVSGFALLTRVHVPLLKRSVAAASLLVFVDVMKELPATLVLRPFDSDTLAVMVYQLARDERLGEAALPALTLVLVGLLPVLLLSRTLGDRDK